MAVSPTSLGSGTTVWASNAFTTGSVTPNANEVVYLCIAAAFGGAPIGDDVLTVDGSGVNLSFDRVGENTQDSGNARRMVAVFRALGASPTTGTITVTEASAQASAGETVKWAVVQFSGCDTSGTNGSGATGTPTEITGSASTADMTITGTPNAGDATFGAIATGANVSGNGITPDALWANIVGVADGGAEELALSADWDSGQDLAPTWSFASVSDYAGVGFIVKAPSGPPLTISGTAVSTIAETDIVAGGKTIIATLSGETYIPLISSEAISFVSSVLSSTNTTIAFTCVLPITQANDILLFEYCHRSTQDGSRIGTLSSVGWSSVVSTRFSGLSTFSGKAFWHRTSSNYLGATIGVSSLIDSSVGIVSVYRGCVSTASPLVGFTPIAEYNTAGNETMAQVSTIISGSMVVLTVVNSPDLAVAGQSSGRFALTERAERLNTGGTDTSICHASALFNDTGTTGPLVWTQTNASSGSWAYALHPQTTALFDPQRQNIINGMDSAQSEANGWDAVVKATQGVGGVVRTSDTVVTITLDAFASYNITAQETITVTMPSSVIVSVTSLVGTPTFTVDATGAGGAQMFTFFQSRLDGAGRGGIFPGNRIMRLKYEVN